MLLNLLSAKWYFLFENVSDSTNFARTAILWLTLIFIAAIAYFALVLKEKSRTDFFKAVLPLAIIYSGIVAVVFLRLTFAESEIVAIMFYPLLAFIIAVVTSATVLCFKRNKPIIITAITVIALTLIVVLVCMGVYFASGKAEEYNYVNISNIENVGLYLSALIIAVIIVITALTVGRKNKKGFDTKSIAYAAVCIAMSFALSYIRLLKLPQGGSVTLASLVPLMIYSYMFGVKKGVFAGFVYGILQAVQDPYIVHPMQFLLDYPIAFSAIGLAGCFAKLEAIKKPQIRFGLGAIIGSLLRFLSHVCAGVFAFSEYSGATTFGGTLAYSLGYNSFVFVDIAIAIVVGIILLSSKNFNSIVKKYSAQA